MDEAKVVMLAAHYRTLDEWELASIYEKSATLTDEAKEALTQVAKERRLSLPDMVAARRTEIAEAASDKEDQDQKSMDSFDRWSKRVMLAFLLLAVVGALLRPERSWETLVSTLTQVLLLTAVLYGGRWLWRRLSAKKG